MFCLKVKLSLVLFFFLTVSIYSQSWVSQTQPVANQLNVNRNQIITVTFNRSMLNTSFINTNVIVRGSYSGSFNKNLSYNSSQRKLTITPLSGFKCGEIIDVVISGSVKDSSGTEMNQSYNFMFTCTANGGKGTFTPLTSAYVVGGCPYKVISGDYDKDGKVDLAVMDSNKITVLKNDGSAVFTVMHVAAGFVGLADMVSGDINNDGYLDLACVNQWNNAFVILINNGNGSFANASSFNSMGSRPMHLTLCNLDNDGYLDVAVTNWGSNSLCLFKNIGSGNFSFQNTIMGLGTRPKAINSGDFNNDGRIDLIIGIDWAPAFAVTLQNDGNYIFTQKQSIVLPDRPYSVTTNDYNADGKIDFCVSNYYDNSISLLLNVGNGLFTFMVYPMGGDGARFLIQGDYDHDGDIDFSIGSAEVGLISVLKNNGTGYFSGIVFVNNFGFPGSLANADLDNDGDLDIAAANTNTGLVAIYKNDNDVGIQPIGNTIPSNYILGQNYPNPFNPSTSFEFSLAKSSDVSIMLFDSRGKEIKELYNGFKAAGTYRYTFNTTGSNITSGVYFYRIVAGDFSQTKKMILMK